MIVSGCASYPVNEGYPGGAVVVEEPDMYLFGGDYGGGRDEYRYSQRGYQSRGVAHPSGHPQVAHASQSHGDAHANSGNEERR